MVEQVSSNRSFNGYQKVFKHESKELECTMQFGAYVPDNADGKKLPALFYLSGLTCTHANFMEKSGFQRLASQHGIIVIHADTSPRNVDIPGDSDSWDFGKGAGFYVDATEAPWSTNYRMYSYITEELFNLVSNTFDIDTHRVGIFGHSMGGHGAIVIGLRNPHKFKSISAFAPICNPISVPWGQKALGNYLGSDQDTWKEYDSCNLVKQYKGDQRVILIDQGTKDNFLPQLKPDSLTSTETVSIQVRMQEEYDHSYYFIASFIADHFDHHAKALAK